MKRLLLAVAVMTVAFAVPIQAQDVVYMHVMGIDGESTDAEHLDWIVAYGISHDGSRPFVIGGGGQPTPGSLELGHVYVLKGTDSSTPLLHNRLNQATNIGTVTIDVCRTGATQDCYYKLILGGTYVGSISLSGSSCIDPATSCVPTQTESVALFFEQITYEYTEFVGGGKAGPAVCSCWDVLNAKSCGC